MAKLYLVRHGQAAAGFGSHADPGLDELGHSQAQTVAQALAPLGPLPILSSPMARAMQTAEPLATIWQQPLKIESRVAEIPSPTEDLEARAAWLRTAMAGGWSELGEDLQQWRQALGNALLEAHQDCVIFSHYVAINAAVGVATQDDRMRIFAPDNCSVTVLANDAGQLSVITLGATAETFIN